MQLGFLGLLLCDVLPHAKRCGKQQCEHQNAFHKGHPSLKVGGPYYKDPGVLCLSVLVEEPDPTDRTCPHLSAARHFGARFAERVLPAGSVEKSAKSLTASARKSSQSIPDRLVIALG